MASDLSPDQRECIDTVRASAESLLTVINDILDFSKIESGKFTLHAQPFNLRTEIEQTLKPFVAGGRRPRPGADLRHRRCGAGAARAAMPAVCGRC